MMDITTYCDIYKCEECPRYGDDCDGDKRVEHTDLISRADAVNAVHKYFVDAFNNEPHEIDEDGDDVFTDMKSVNALLHHNKMVSKALKALPSAEAEWIPCSERLPEKDELVLVTVWNDVTIAWRNIYGGWESAEDMYEKGDVIAWMPLPKPYKGGDTE